MGLPGLIEIVMNRGLDRDIRLKAWALMKGMNPQPKDLHTVSKCNLVVIAEDAKKLLNKKPKKGPGRKAKRVRATAEPSLAETVSSH